MKFPETVFTHRSPKVLLRATYDLRVHYTGFNRFSYGFFNNENLLIAYYKGKVVKTHKDTFVYSIALKIILPRKRNRNLYLISGGTSTSIFGEIITEVDRYYSILHKICICSEQGVNNEVTF